MHESRLPCCSLPLSPTPFLSAHSVYLECWCGCCTTGSDVSDKRKLFTVDQALIHEIVKTSFTTTALIHKNTHTCLTHSHASVILAVMKKTRSKGAPPQSGWQSDHWCETDCSLSAHTHTHTHGSLCVNFYINKPVSFSGLEEHTLRCTKCVNILQTADRLTANHVSLSSAYLITLTVVAVHVAAAEVQQHVGTQSAVRVLPASLRRAFTDDWAFPWCPAETQHFLFLCLTCWKKEMGYRASEVRPGWHKMTALIFAFNAVSCCAVLGSVVINIVCQANRVM